MQTKWPKILEILISYVSTQRRQLEEEHLGCLGKAALLNIHPFSTAAPNSHSFYMSGRLIWGADRLFMVERLLGKKDAAPERLVTAGKKQVTKKVIKHNNYEKN